MICSRTLYIGMMLLLIVTIFIAPDTKGSRSWLVMGPVSLQPAEFAKFATALALAKYMNSLFIQHKERKCALCWVYDSSPDVADYRSAGDGFCIGVSCIFLGALSGGMPGVVLFSGICAVVYFLWSASVLMR